MTYEFIAICLYLFFGMCFGFVTFPYRHLFSEGPEKPENSDQTSPLEGRIFLGVNLYMAVAHHGHHRLEHSVGRFEAQKTSAKGLKLCLDEIQTLQIPRNQSVC